MLELGRGRKHARPAIVAGLLHDMGLRFSRPADDIQMMMAFGMFDSQLSHRFVHRLNPMVPGLHLALASSNLVFCASQHGWAVIQGWLSTSASNPFCLCCFASPVMLICCMP